MLRRLPILLFMLFSQPLPADELLIIVANNSTVTQLNQLQLEHIYRRQTLINSQGKRWAPINLTVNDPLRLAFSKQLFKQRPEEMESYWNEQYFKGISPPYVVSSEEAVLRFITSTPNAIGYINACHLDSRVRVLLKLTVERLKNSPCN